VRIPLKNRARAADEPGEGTLMDIDAGIIEQYADHLYRKAAARVTGHTIVGALLGALAGALAGDLIHITSQPLIPSRLGYAMVLIGGAALGFAGYRLGGQRSFELRLQAQMALHQLQVERTILRPAAFVAAVAQKSETLAPQAAPVAPAPFAPPPLAPPAPAPVPAAVAPAPPASPPEAQQAPAPVPPPAAPVAPPAPVPAPPAATLPPAPAFTVPPRLVEPPPLAAPPLMPPVSARRYS
jgi:hypothetical protein